MEEEITKILEEDYKAFQKELIYWQNHKAKLINPKNMTKMIASATTIAYIDSLYQRLNIERRDK